MRLKHYSLRSEQTYVDWIKRYILFHGKQHPKDMGVSEEMLRQAQHDNEKETAHLLESGICTLQELPSHKSLS
jgi:hypothetical protein